MKISLSKQSLQTALGNLGKATPTRSTIPILNTVLFTAKDTLSLRTTDLEISIIALVESKINEEGSVAIPYRTLSDTVNAMPDTELAIEALVLLVEAAGPRTGTSRVAKRALHPTP